MLYTRANSTDSLEVRHIVLHKLNRFGTVFMHGHTTTMSVLVVNYYTLVVNKSYFCFRIVYLHH